MVCACKKRFAVQILTYSGAIITHMAPAEFLVMGGTHGTERDGVELVRSLQREPIPKVDALLSNERAARKNMRFIDVELSTATPGSNTYEGRRLAEIIAIGKPYKLILDFHNALG